MAEYQSNSSNTIGPDSHDDLIVQIDAGIVALESGLFTEVADKDIDAFLDQLAEPVTA